MNSKILFTFVFCLLGSTIISCINGSCDPVPSNFKINGIESVNLKYVSGGTYSYSWETLNDTQAVSWDKFFVRFGFQVSYISAVAGDFGGTLMATSCEQAGDDGDKIGVDTVIIKTVNDYNEKYQAGSVLNDIVLTHDMSSATVDFDTFMSLQEYLIVNAAGVRFDSFELRLTEAPTNNNSFSVDVTYILNNGEVFQHRTAPVNLKK